MTDKDDIDILLKEAQRHYMLGKSTGLCEMYSDAALRVSIAESNLAMAIMMKTMLEKEKS